MEIFSFRQFLLYHRDYFMKLTLNILVSKQIATFIPLEYHQVHLNMNYLPLFFPCSSFSASRVRGFVIVIADRGGEFSIF